MTTNMPVGLPSEFAVSDYVPRPFSDVVSDLVAKANDAFAEATEEAIGASRRRAPCWAKVEGG